MTSDPAAPVLSAYVPVRDRNRFTLPNLAVRMRIGLSPDDGVLILAAPDAAGDGVWHLRIVSFAAASRGALPAAGEVPMARPTYVSPWNDAPAAVLE